MLMTFPLWLATKLVTWWILVCLWIVKSSVKVLVKLTKKQAMIVLRTPPDNGGSNEDQ